MPFSIDRLAQIGRPLVWGASTCVLLALGACTSLNDNMRGMVDSVTPYRPEVLQGNFISSEQVQAVRPGMSRVQVRDILGTPLVASAFHSDRWDYVFSLKRNGIEPQRFKLTAYFNGDTLDRIEGDDMLSEEEFVQRLTEKRKAPKVPVLEASPEQLEKFRQENKTRAAPDSEEDLPSSAAPTDYPQLEPSR